MVTKEKQNFYLTSLLKEDEKKFNLKFAGVQRQHTQTCIASKKARNFSGRDKKDNNESSEIF